MKLSGWNADLADLSVQLIAAGLLWALRNPNYPGFFCRSREAGKEETGRNTRDFFPVSSRQNAFLRLRVAASAEQGRPCLLNMQDA